VIGTSTARISASSRPAEQSGNGGPEFIVVASGFVASATARIGESMAAAAAAGGQGVEGMASESGV